VKRTRLTRAASLAVKRPAITIAADHEHDPDARDALIDLLVELLDARRHSKRG
jgi:hypothetical protein